MAKVTLERVSKRFGSVTAVRDVSLEVRDEEFLVLVGPSGCGKSTLLRLVAGLEELSAGNIYIGDRVVNNLAPKDRDIAMVFQNYALYPHLNVFDNMAFALRLRKVPPAEIAARVRVAAAILGIEDLLNRRPKELSGGQRQRVALGRAIVREPKVFLMDEPLSNLDAKLRVQMRTELAKLRDRLRATIIYVTHDQTEAMTMGDRIAVMKDGAVLQAAPPREVYDRPDNMFVAGFIGSPPMNFLRCQVTLGDPADAGDKGGTPVAGELRLRGKGFSLPVPPADQQALGRYLGREVIMGIRPEYVSDAAPDLARWSAGQVDCHVDVVEPLGSEVYLHLLLGDQALTARVSRDSRAAKGQQVRVALNLDGVHFFDPQTEKAIR